MYEASDSLFISIYMILEAFLRVVEPGHFPIAKPGSYGWYDPTKNWFEMTAREKFRKDKALLYGTLPDFFVLCQGAPIFGPEDEFTRGLKDAFKTKKLPLWLIFAAQVYVDIRHQLREAVSRGVFDLQTVGRLVYNSTETNLEFHSSLRVENGHGIMT